MNFVIDHFYIKVANLDEAIDFYQQVFDRKISNREGDRWADFNDKNGRVYLGILNSSLDKESVIYGDNVTLSIKTDDIKKFHQKISNLKPKTITKIHTITNPALYKYFQFEDLWGNIWEVAEYNY